METYISVGLEMKLVRFSRWLFN